ncbi:glycosyltransferase family 4 protein [bacterium]|nr:glycosyltransferase family 4 protein [bacterium]
MRIAIVHNQYGKFSGEEAVVRDQAALLRSRGHEVEFFLRSSTELMQMHWGAAKAFFCGIYNPFAVCAFRAFLKEKKPDIVHIHNLYPLISPAILPECTKAGIPVIMSVHNYRLICPNGLLMNQTGICEKCAGGHEWNCIRYNCENSLFKSIGYALRNWFSRRRRYYLQNVDMFAVLTDFQREKLVSAGIQRNRISVLPNMVPGPENAADGDEEEVASGQYVAFAGRCSREKGIDLILETAKRLPHINFKLAGTGAEQYRKNAPANVTFCGHLAQTALNDFFRNSRFAIVASTWYETFGIVAVEAMLNAKTVIYPDFGAMHEVVGGNKFGVSFPMGNVSALAQAVENLWEDPAQSRELGKKAQKRAFELYSPEIYFDKLIKIYALAAKK